MLVFIIYVFNHYFSFHNFSLVLLKDHKQHLAFVCRLPHDVASFDISPLLHVGHANHRHCTRRKYHVGWRNDKEEGSKRHRCFQHSLYRPVSLLRSRRQICWIDQRRRTTIFRRMQPFNSFRLYSNYFLAFLLTLVYS